MLFLSGGHIPLSFKVYAFVWQSIYFIKVDEKDASILQLLSIQLLL